MAPESPRRARSGGGQLDPARQAGAATPPAARGRASGLRLALALALFECLLALAAGAPFVEGVAGWLLFWGAPLLVYGLGGLLLGGLLLRRPPARLLAAVALAGYAVFQLAAHGRPLLAPPDLSALALALAAVAAGAAVLMLRLRPRAVRLLVLHGWGAAAAGSLLLALDSQPALRMAPPAAPATGPNLVLISWDTVRADLLAPWGGTGLATPNLQRLAEEGVVFEQAVSPAPITGPSHASMLTGLYPPSHGLRSNGTSFLSPSVPVLASILRERGYDTGAFVSGYPLLARYGLARGFSLYDDRLRNHFTSVLQDFGPKSFLWITMLRQVVQGRNRSSQTGEVVAARAGAWYRATQGPAFLFVHFYDAHGPFEPREPWRARALAAEPAARPRAADAGQGQHMLTLQRGEIAYLDELLGGLRNALEEKDPGLEHTLLVLTSDHGECFGEGGIVGEHIPSLYEATQHVPLVLRLPGGDSGGRRIPDLVSLIDLMPTFLEAAGAAPPPVSGLPGRPLQDWIAGRPAARREWVYLEAFQDTLRGARKQGLRSEDWKLVRWLDGTRQLFRLGEGETQDLQAREPGKAAELEDKLDRFLAVLPVARDTRRALTAQERAALEEIGYVDEGGPED